MLRIAHLSDFHFTSFTCNPFRLCSKRLFGLINFALTRNKTLSRAPLDALIPLLQALQIDLVLLGGDFCTTALLEEFEAAGQWVKRLALPWFAVPGNHDVYTKRAERKRHFYRYFANPPSSQSRLQTEGVEAHPIAPGWWLVCLNTARATSPSSSRGLFSEESERHLRAELQGLPEDASILLFTHYPFFQNDEPHRTLERGEALEAFVRSEPRIKAYLHGHTHRHIIADLQPSGLPLVLDSGCSADSARGSWNLLTLGREAVGVTPYRWGEGAWTPEQEETIRWSR